MVDNLENQQFKPLHLTPFFEIVLEFSEVPECSISIVIFGHDQGQNVQEEPKPSVCLQPLNLTSYKLSLQD